jgi:UDP-N-acetylmuramoylalanine--D-glutamate ligase
VLLHGAGVETTAAAEGFRRRGAEVSLYAPNGGAIGGLGPVPLEEAEALLGSSLYLRSPGVPPSDPFYQKAEKVAPFVSTPTGWWLANEAPPGAVTVTGTKGKSTTTALLASCLRAAGLTAEAYGNIGRPPLSTETVGETAPVLELSSYMMHDLPEAEHLHLVTSLYEDHLDWHGSKAAYHGAKLRPFRRSSPARGLAPKAVIEAHDLPGSVAAIEDLVTPALEIGRHRIEPGPKERGFHGGPLRLALRAAAAATALMVGDERAARAASEAAEGFEGLPSRQAIIASKDGRTWVDDALATIPEAVLSALERFEGRPVTLVLGGADRGIDYAPLARALTGKKSVTPIAFGPAAKRFAFPHLPAESLEDALVLAAERTPVGGVILFSPAAPSAPPDKDYKERASVFRAAAAKAL